jgi:hypothetical protein
MGNRFQFGEPVQWLTRAPCQVRTCTQSSWHAHRGHVVQTGFWDLVSVQPAETNDLVVTEVASLCRASPMAGSRRMSKSVGLTHHPEVASAPGTRVGVGLQSRARQAAD